MSDEKNDLKLGFLLKSLLKERSLSMRKLSVLTGIDIATISRIVNGKQSARPKHLQQIASSLDVPTGKLFDAAGFSPEREDKKGYSDIQTSMNTIQKVLESSNLNSQLFTIERVEQELANYEQYARTEEGKRIIVEEFPRKIQQVEGVGPFIEHLKQMHIQFLQDTITPTERAMLGSALLYFILSTDIIPDYIFPIGYLDDAIAVQLVLNRILQMNTKEKKQNKKMNASENIRNRRFRFVKDVNL